MSRANKFVALAILGALAANPAFAEDMPAATVNGVSIPQVRVDMRARDTIAQGQADSMELQKAILEDLIDIEVMVQEATRLGLDKSDEVVQQTEMARQSVLANAFVQDYAKNYQISEERFTQEYDRQKALLGDKEYNARHIMVDTEDEAKSIIALLAKKGNKFEKLAAEKSKDSESAAQGGSLGWAVPSNFVPPFANALRNLKKGERTQEPVKTEFGWHIIMVDDIRDLKAPPFDEVKPQLLQRLQRQAIKKAIDDLRAKAIIE